MTPILALALLVFCSALSYLVIVAILKGPRVGAVILGAALAVVLMPMVAYAGGGGTAATGDSPKDILGYTIGVAVAAGLTWIGKHVVALLKSSKAGKDTLDAAHTLGLDERVAELSMHYATQEASKLSHKLTDSQIMGKALEFAEDQGYTGDDLKRMAKTIEAKIAMSKALAKLAAAAKRFEDAMPGLQAKIDSLPKGTPPKLPPTPSAGTASGEVEAP